MFKKIFSVMVLAAVMSVAVFADQAAYISERNAIRASDLIRKQYDLVHYCAPCSDSEQKHEVIQSVEYGHTGSENYYEVKVNGKAVDLAYIYIQTPNGRWTNVARHLGIRVRDVPTTIRFVGN